MKKIKGVIIALSVFLLCGCSVEYDLTINKDSSVNEKVIATENTNRMKANTGLDESNSVTYLYDMFKRKNYKTRLHKTKKDDNTVVTVTGNYDSIKDYESNFTSDLFEEVNITKKGDIVTINMDQSKELSSTSNRSLVYDDVTIKFNIPFKVTEHNADSAVKGTYTWHIKKDQDLKHIKISYDESVYQNSKTFKMGKTKLNIKLEVLTIGIALFVILFITTIVVINNNRNNKI